MSIKTTQPHWQIPAKTFLLGEYVALTGKSALVLTTSPCFTLHLTCQPGLQGIHPQSPAGQYWLQQNFADVGLVWSDPYNGCGGLGASSAQFIATFKAVCHVQKNEVNNNQLLDAYYHYSWDGQGLRPSGYDVIAQLHDQCVYINQQQALDCYRWLFTDLAFLLVHSGQKMATHHYLQTTQLPAELDQLVALVEQAKYAFVNQNDEHLINAINSYHNQLLSLGLVAEHTQQLIDTFKKRFALSAIKGCGAMGADVLLLVGSCSIMQQVEQQLSAERWHILATNQQIHEAKSGIAYA